MTIKENFNTEAGTINAGSSRTITRSFFVYPFDTWGGADAEMHTVDNGGVVVGDEYDLGSNSDGDTVSAIYYGTRSWNRVDGQSNTWLFNLEYTTATTDSGSPNVYLSTQGDSRGNIKNVWRTVGTHGWGVTSWDNPSFGDIGGNPVDSGGTPTSIVAVDRRFETTELKSTFPSLGALSNLVGTRNGACHDGGEIGTVLYTGFGWSLDTSSNMWQIRHTFAVDKFTYHAEQVARTDPSGEVNVSRFGSAPDYVYAASHVYFIQPFPTALWVGIPEFCDDCCG